MPPLVALTDPDRIPDVAAFAATLPDGCALIYRHFGRAQRFREADTLAAIAREKGIVLLIAADPELAAASDADGVHWPARELRTARDWRRRTPEAVMTVSAHSRAELAAAAQAGADAALLSPVFGTRSAKSGPPLGRLRAAALVRQAELPVYALGGITADSARNLETSGFSGLAAIDGLKR